MPKQTENFNELVSSLSKSSRGALQRACAGIDLSVEDESKSAVRSLQQVGFLDSSMQPTQIGLDAVDIINEYWAPKQASRPSCLCQAK